MGIKLKFDNIRKHFFGVTALDGVSFEVEEGHTIGLIGENGAGKSTLMNILGGVLHPDGGKMSLDGEVYLPSNPREATLQGVAFIHQELNLFTNLTIAENIYIDSFPKLHKTSLIDKKKMNGSLKTLLKTLDLNYSPSTTVENLAPGERQLVEIAKALHSDAYLIIFDEPTTSLTARETEKLFSILERLKNEGRTIIYISHILGEVKRITDDIVVLRDGKVTGSSETATTKIPDMIRLMVGRERDSMFPERTSKPTDTTILKVEGLSQPGIVGDVNFKVHQGEVLGIFGLMGSGRTEMARMLFGVDTYRSGTISIDGKQLPKNTPRSCIERGMAFVTEDRREEGLLMNVAITENIGLVSLPDYCRNLVKWVDAKKMNTEAGIIGDSLKLKAADIRKQPAMSLSGGNQQKVVIGKWLMTKPRLLIMDEPTRGIDVGAKYEVYNIMDRLAADNSGILFISSEIEELIGIADRIIVMSQGEIVNVFEKKDFDVTALMAAAFREAVA